MKHINASNFKKDEYYSKVVRAMKAILEKQDYVAPIDVLIEIGLLAKKDVENWRFGRVAFLEKVIMCNLSKASRILRLINLHAQELKLKASMTVYNKWGKGVRMGLRCSKTGDPNLEKAYSTHYVVLAPYRKHDKKKTELVAEGASPTQSESRENNS